MLKLYFHPFSTYSRRVSMTLLEKQIPYGPVLVDMVARKHREPEYLSLNPYGRVPTLVDEEVTLYESTTIMEYLEAKFPQPALIPSDAAGKALVSMHMKLCDLQFTRQCGQIIFPKRFLPKERWDEALFAEARKEIDRHLAILAGQLGGNDYLVRNQLSLADIAYAPFLAFFELIEVVPPPAIASWSQRLLSRPSALQTQPGK